MRKIKLSKRRFSSKAPKSTLVDDSTYEWAKNYKWHLGCGYATAIIGGSKCLLHHCVVGQPIQPKHVIDHLNGNPLDNRACNLEVVSHAENVRRARPKY